MIKYTGYLHFSQITLLANVKLPGKPPQIYNSFKTANQFQ